MASKYREGEQKNSCERKEQQKAFHVFKSREIISIKFIFASERASSHLINSSASSLASLVNWLFVFASRSEKLN